MGSLGHRRVTRYILSNPSEHSNSAFFSWFIQAQKFSTFEGF